jgi:thiamine biosynthesis lipoprotein ApbE/arylsulfatase A-like enzyme
MLTLAAPAPSRAQGAAPPPNIVFILADDLGWGDLGSYGQQKIETPSLDALAARGMRFTQHYAGNAVCAPSRGVLLTGRHPGHAAIRDNRELSPEGQWPLPGPELTIAELLKPLGYATGAMGKWGLGPPGSEGDPLKQGFDHFFGYNCQRQAHGYYPSSLWDDGQRVGLGNPEIAPHQKLAPGADPLDPKSYAAFSGNVYAPDVIWARARDFIRANRARPFFAFLPTTLPHLGLSVPEDSLAAYRGRFAETPYVGDKEYLPQQTPRAAYAAMVTRLDRELGRILDLVAELGLEERTIVVFASDNGPSFDVGGADSAFFRSAGPFRALKGSLYEGGLRVPAIVSWKGRIAAGSTSDRVTGFEDWLPTLLELAGAAASIPPRVDGLSFAPTLLGRAQEPRPWLYRELAGYGGQQMVRVGDWTGVRQGLAKPDAPKLELYDLASDVAQARDVAAANPDVVARLEAVLAREHQPSPSFPLAAIDPKPERHAARATKVGSRELLAASDSRWADALGALGAGGKPSPSSWVCHEATRVAMGSAATVRTCGPDKAALVPAVEAGLDEVDRLDALLSHYREDTPLSRLNREAALAAVAVPPELADFLAVCLRWSRDSDGAFDVTVGPLMKAWGFFRDEGRRPDDAQLQAALARVGYRHVAVDRARHTVRFDRPGVELDLGGIGKGYAADRVATLLRRHGVASALVNLGGSSVYGLGTPPGAAGWEVGIADPTAPDRTATTVSLRDQALSVSGGYARFFVKDGVTYSHIMDPRTGRPVQGVLSVAVVSASATDGDALDNVLFVQGPEKARAFVRKLPPSTGASGWFFLPAEGGGYRLERFGVSARR